MRTVAACDGEAATAAPENRAWRRETANNPPILGCWRDFVDGIVAKETVLPSRKRVAMMISRILIERSGEEVML
jgi:hypothetical protein